MLECDQRNQPRKPLDHVEHVDVFWRFLNTLTQNPLVFSKDFDFLNLGHGFLSNLAQSNCFQPRACCEITCTSCGFSQAFWKCGKCALHFGFPAHTGLRISCVRAMILWVLAFVLCWHTPYLPQLLAEKIASWRLKTPTVIQVRYHRGPEKASWEWVFCFKKIRSNTSEPNRLSTGQKWCRYYCICR